MYANKTVMLRHLDLILKGLSNLHKYNIPLFIHGQMITDVVCGSRAISYHLPIYLFINDDEQFACLFKVFYRYISKFEFKTVHVCINHGGNVCIQTQAMQGKQILLKFQNNFLLLT